MPDDQARPQPWDSENRDVLSRRARRPSFGWEYGSDPAQVADVYLPSASPAVSAEDRPRTPIMLVHGGFWRPEYDRIHLRPMAAALADIGHAVVLLEYRRTPGDPDATISDLRSALDAVPELVMAHELGDPRALQLVGHSAGGHLALCLVALPEATVGSCLVLAPVADLALAERLDLDGGAVAAFLGTTAADRPDLDPCRLPGPVVPVAVVHGLDDSLVPIDVARTYRPPGATLVELAACAHFELIDPNSDAWPIVMVELDRLAARALRPDRAKPTADPRWGIE